MLILALGRQPALGLAEAEALYGADAVRAIAGGTVAVVDSDEIIRELGGTIKVARVIDSLPATNIDAISKLLGRRLPSYVKPLKRDGKIKLGISAYDLNASTASLNRTGLYLKNTLKRIGRSARVVPNKEAVLSSAQVIHGGILSNVGIELVLVRDGDQTLVGRTIHEQDIEGYGERDHGRPFRNAFVGMLPPKLAQIMINLASGDSLRGSAQNSLQDAKILGADSEAGPEETEEPAPASTPVLLDPFCGTGVVLQEAALYDYDIYGTDLSEKMVRYTRDNIVWLFDKKHVRTGINYEVADATDHIWRQPIDLVVCEGYLGTPMGGQIPDKEKLAINIQECDSIMRRFLQNISTQIKPGTPLCIAAPSWFVGRDTYHLPVVDELDALGYEQVAFTHATNEELIYRRENQTVGRELLVLKKK